MNATIRNLFRVVAIAALVLIALPPFAAAQNAFRSAGEKITGEAYWPARAATRYIESARNYAQEYQGYIARAPRPEPAVVQEVSRTLNGYLDEANKHLAAMKKDFAGRWFVGQDVAASRLRAGKTGGRMLYLGLGTERPSDAAAT